MSVLILKPDGRHPEYAAAVAAFRDTYEKVCAERLPICETDDGVSDLFVIGSEHVNTFFSGKEPTGLSRDSDAYALLSYRSDGRRITVLAGGRLRSTLYAVYDFFERFADCHYFWDGDVIPPRENIALTDFRIFETPRFEYRGLRYFAHRGLKRFQAEHWSLEDWKTELDWMVKKRLNFFMLRIGMDDTWQRAFPDTVPYADPFLNVEDLRGYNDRSDFWTLRYRGELREQILEYARSLDLIYPTDCGTMTHWYSRTPKEFLEQKRPSFLPQHDTQYLENDSGRVWDFRAPENMEAYMRLTQTMVEQYDKQTAYFHTIGVGERRIFEDDQKNLELKLDLYQKTATALRGRYPHAKLFLASWDFAGWWKGEEVERLVREQNPENTVLMDYTSEMNDPEQSFLRWGVVGRFPWIFGLFHAYASESELRGPYRRTEQRLRVAADDPYCKGMILWPELSHSDPLLLEFLSQNAWSPLRHSVEELVTDLCRKRYGADWQRMNDCWQSFLPFLMQGDWGGFGARREDDPADVEYYNHWQSHSDLWVKPLKILTLRNDRRFGRQIKKKTEDALAALPDVIKALEGLAEDDAVQNDPFFRRDAIDMLRTALGRFLNFLLARALYEPSSERIRRILEVYFTLHGALRELLAQSEDFSLLASLRDLERTAPVNPRFERTFKENVGCSYCRQYAYELMDSLFAPEAALAFAWLADGKQEEKIPAVNEEKERIFEHYLATPLADMAPSGVREDLQKSALRAIGALRLVTDVL